MNWLAEPQQGYWLSERAKKRSAFSHTRCGENLVPGAQCPNCRKPLLCILALDSRDPRVDVSGCPLESLPLLFCWTCNVAQDRFFYQLHSGGVSLLRYKKGGVTDDFPYCSYPDHFPQSPLDLTPVTQEDQEMIRRLNAGEDMWLTNERAEELLVPDHQVGGEPILVSGDDRLKCVVCKRISPFFASVGDNAGHNLSFTENEFVQTLFFLCRRCWVVGAVQQSD